MSWSSTVEKQTFVLPIKLFIDFKMFLRTYQNTCTQQLLSGASVSGPYQRRDLSNCGAGRLPVAINCGVLNVKP